jgi:hypothetical protein
MDNTTAKVAASRGERRSGMKKRKLNELVVNVDSVWYSWSFSLFGADSMTLYQTVKTQLDLSGCTRIISGFTLRGGSKTPDPLLPVHSTLKSFLIFSASLPTEITLEFGSYS